MYVTGEVRYINPLTTIECDSGTKEKEPYRRDYSSPRTSPLRMIVIITKHMWIMLTHEN